MEITQFTYFQQVGGLDLDLIPAEITYGLERLAMFMQGVDSVWEVEWAEGVTYADVYREGERQWSAYNYEHAPVDVLLRRFGEHEDECAALLELGLPLPAYDQVLKASHAFNLLDARVCAVGDRAGSFRRPRAEPRAEGVSGVPRDGDRCPVCCLRSAARSCPQLPSTRRAEQLPSLVLEHLGAEPDEVFLGPRRLAVLVRSLPAETPEEWVQGPPLKVGGEGGRGVRAQARDHARGPRRARGSVGLE